MRPLSARIHLFFGIFPGVFALTAEAEAPTLRDGQVPVLKAGPVDGSGGLTGAAFPDMAAGRAPLATPGAAAGGAPLAAAVELGSTSISSSAKGSTTLMLA